MSCLCGGKFVGRDVQATSALRLDLFTLLSEQRKSAPAIGWWNSQGVWRSASVIPVLVGFLKVDWDLAFTTTHSQIGARVDSLT